MSGMYDIAEIGDMRISDKELRSLVVAAVSDFAKERNLGEISEVNSLLVVKNVETPYELMVKIWPKNVKHYELKPYQVGFNSTCYMKEGEEARRRLDATISRYIMRRNIKLMREKQSKIIL